MRPISSNTVWTRSLVPLVCALMLTRTATADADAETEAGSEAEARSMAEARSETGTEARSGSEARFVAEARPALDDAPDDEVVETPSESTGARHGRRRWSDGPRRIPTPGGRSLERARALGLGSHEAGTLLLHHAARAEWRRAAGSTTSRTLRWPVDIGAIGRGFGYVRHDRPNKRHNGFDIATPRGMVIRAAAEGIVAYASNELSGYGSCVLIVHPNGWVTLYAHADRITVQPGYRVRRGERIGFVGATGRADGPHLHFELHVDGEAVDPRSYFDGEPWVAGRERLAVLRRNHGGHTYGHLGEIDADYGADTPPVALRRPSAARERPSRTASRTEAPRTDTRRPETSRVEASRAEASRAEASRVEASRVEASRAESARTETHRAETARTETSRAERARAETRRTETARATPSPRTTTVTLAPARAPAPVTSDLERWLASGPSTAERRSLRAARVATYAAPIRVEAETSFREGALRYVAPVGTNVRASAPGRVAFIGRDVRGARTTVIVLHENGFISLYSGAMDPTVEVGAIIALGDRIGIVRDASFGFLFELLDRGQPLDPRTRFAVTTDAVAAR